jgi:hypothetical protein
MTHVAAAIARLAGPNGSAGGVRDYQIYGIKLRSEIPLAYQEQPSGGVADVTFFAAPRNWIAKVRADLPNLSNPHDWYERRCAADGSDFLLFPGLFEFMVSPDGRSVAFEQLERSTAESFQTYLLGHTLSYALVKQGFEPLHASTVVIDGAAIAFLGSSGQGKSTLAAAFLHAGHQILTDDLLLIREVDGIYCGFSGPPRLKLFPEVARWFLPMQASSTPMNPETEKLIVALEPPQMHLSPAPIKGFFVLDEWEQDSVGMRLSALSGTESVLQLLRSSFNTRLVTPERLRRQFVAAREWAARIAVRRIVYPRKLADIDQVREIIIRSTSTCMS